MRKRKRFRFIALLAAVTIWTYTVVETEEWTVRSDRIPAAFDGMRIALVTDVHGRTLGKNQARLLKAVKAARPDLIAISGDLADECTDRAMVAPLLRQQTAVAPTYYVTGNHEWSRDDTEDLLREIGDCGVKVLRNDYELLEQEGQILVLAGAEDPMAYADQEKPAAFAARIRQEVAGDPYTVMISHRNDTLHLWASAETDLVLAGHGHGGVIRLPFVGGLLGVDREFFPDDAEGLYHSGRTTLAVSRGLGGIRLWNRPHLPTIVLQTEKP